MSIRPFFPLCNFCGTIKNITYLLRSKHLFFETYSLTTTDKDQWHMICLKTIHQGSSKFWYDQRWGRITALNFYCVCHMRESTEKSSIVGVKLLMNYCPTEWGHEKEITVSKKKFQKRNKVSLVRFRNCAFLVVNATKNFALATSRWLTISCHDKYANNNFDFQQNN